MIGELYSFDIIDHDTGVAGGTADVFRAEANVPGIGRTNVAVKIFRVFGLVEDELKRLRYSFMLPFCFPITFSCSYPCSFVHHAACARPLRLFRALLTCIFFLLQSDTAYSWSYESFWNR